jgi:hypothetical protein
MRAGRDLSSAGMMQENPYFTGDPGRIRTCDLQLRRHRGNQSFQCHSDKGALFAHFDRKGLLAVVRTTVGLRCWRAEPLLFLAGLLSNDPPTPALIIEVLTAFAIHHDKNLLGRFDRTRRPRKILLCLNSIHVRLLPRKTIRNCGAQQTTRRYGGSARAENSSFLRRSSSV